MRVLYFSPRDCWPVTTGARLRDFYFAREVAREAQLTYLGFLSPENDTSGEIQREFLEPLGAGVILVPRYTAYSRKNVVLGLLGPDPISVLNYRSAAMADELRRLLAAENFDIVQMEGVHLSSYLDILREGPRPPKLVSDWHNIESELMARYAENNGSALRRLYAKRTSHLLRKLEDQLLRRCDAHVVCSEREKQLLLKRIPAARIEAIGNGVDVDGHSDAAIDDACRDFPELGSGNDRRDKIVFVGSMDYHANIDAAVYFAREIWPAIRTARPELEFLIVGSRPAPEVLALAQHPGIQVTGTVADVRPFYRCAKAVVIPARVASGTRLKALEAMAAGVPVISTTLGAEGLEVAPGRNIILADSPSDFAAAVLALRENTPKWRTLSEEGRRFVAARYDWVYLGSKLRDLYREVIVGAPK